MLEEQIHQGRTRKKPVALGVIGLVLALLVVGADAAAAGGSTAPRLRHGRQLQDPMTAFENGLPQYTKTALQQANSAQRQALDWLADHPDLASVGEDNDWRMNQLFAMATIYYSMDGPNWTRDIVWGPGDTKNWLNYTHPECEWDTAWTRVCNDQGQLMTLDLDYLKSSAAGFLSIPPEIGLLSNLIRVSYHVDMKVSIDDLLPVQTFDLPDLQTISLLSWGGTVPTQIGNLASSLKSLSIYHNYILENGGSYTYGGALPTQLGLCSNLMDLTLHNVALEGILPTQLGNLVNLNRLTITGTKVNGIIPTELGGLTGMTQITIEDNADLGGVLPAQLGMMSRLSQINIKNNPKLVGPIPNELVGLPSMQILDLSNNALRDGGLPSDIGQATKLRRIHLGGNQLEGALPSGLAKLTRLTQFEAPFNRFNESLPSELGQMTKLDHFNVSYNLLTALPTELGNMNAIKVFDASHNELAGNLPPQVLNMGPNARLQGWELDLSYNNLNGPLSGNAIGGMTRILKLNLSNNQFNGAIPTQFGLLSRMDKLDLSSNSFVSNIPTHFGLMEELTYLDLSNIPQLTGPIPSQMAKMTSLMDLNLSNSGLSGIIPVELGDLVLEHDLHFMDVTGNSGLEGIIPAGLCELNTNETYCVYRAECTFDYDCGNLCGCDKEDCFCSNVIIERNGGPFD